MPDHHAPLTIAETFGLSPVRERLAEALFMLRGDPYTPPSRFGLSSLRVLKPALALRCYLGQRRPDRRVPIYNLFNHTPTPIEQGWSVRVTQVRDFRGGRNTYDSHNGTDFAVPPGTPVVAAAPGVVLRVSSEFHRGGLKVFIDHGDGVVTTSNHLGRALVRPGQRVRRGEPVALSGSSGVDCVAAFPWTAPHVHFNVWLDGRNVDPFAAGDEPSLWRRRNDPAPCPEPPDAAAQAQDATFAPTAWDHAAVHRAIAACQDAPLRKALAAQPDQDRRAMDTLFRLNYFPTRFEGQHALYRRRHPREPLLDLLFSAEAFDGVVFLYD
jgi:murein DD-endopeptidase MepM/ murein hydrolase activator NlpD